MNLPIFAELSGGAIAGIVIACVVAGLFAGYYLARFVFKRELKKNPPISEKQIRAMFTSMGRKPSEAQVRQVMRAMEESNKNN